MRILLIEDDAAMREVISKMLRGPDFEVAEASDIATAQTLIANAEPFEVALVDFWIGKDSAVPFLDYMNSRHPETSVILITGGGHGVSIETSMAIGDLSGAVRFLQKPFLKDELFRALKNL